MAKSELKAKARVMRTGGESIKKIAFKLHVSPGSVSNWCNDIHLNSEQIANLEKRAKDPFYGKRLAYSQKQQAIKNEKIRRLFIEGKSEVGTITDRELFIAGIALYWGEGFKKDTQVGFANIDPKMINFFIKWLKECFGYKNEDLYLRLTINISHKNRVSEIQNYWTKETGIPLKQFRKPFYQNVKWKKTYENPENYYGVLRVKVRKSIDFLRKIDGYIAGLKNSLT